MFDKEVFQSYLLTYKKDFPTWLNDEKYKWEMVKHFQDNFDLDAENFSEMLERSLKNISVKGKLIYNFSVITIKNFSKNEPETVRKMFRELFNEKIDIWTRFENFKSNSEVLFEKYGKFNEKHRQDERAISVYLWLKNPDKYYIYKFSALKNAAERLKSDYKFEKGDYENNIRRFYKFCDEICEEFKKDTELVDLLKNNLTESCYPDKNLKILTTDFVFYVGKE